MVRNRRHAACLLLAAFILPATGGYASAAGFATFGFVSLDPAPGSAQQAQPPSSPVLALAGGTILDLTHWGRTTDDTHDAVVLIQDGRILAAGPRSSIAIPKNARVLDCTGKYLIPGLIDGYAGMNNQNEANATLYMGITTIVGTTDERRGPLILNAHPGPHVYMLDSVGTTDDWSLLGIKREWVTRLHQHGRKAELSPEDTAQQLADIAKMGTRVVLLGHTLKAANSQWIINRAHQLGLVTYGEFASTPYKVGIEAGINALLHMGSYELGVAPDELQQPLVDDPEGPAAKTAYGYSETLPPYDHNLHQYAQFLGTHHAALMPTFSAFYLRLPDHRNLWQDPVSTLIDPKHLDMAPDKQTGELPPDTSSNNMPAWARHMPGSVSRWIDQGNRKREEKRARNLWQINITLLTGHPHYLAGSGAGAYGTMPGISLHTELEMLTRLGLTSREALASATANYSEQFGWHELGLIAPNRRADILVLDADPTASVWNTRKIDTLLLEGNIIDRDALLKQH